MDGDQDHELHLPAAPFPAPPPFWKHFTVDNVNRLAVLEADTDASENELPVELNYLKPPPAPSQSDDVYSVFSVPQPLNPAPAAPPAGILLFDPTSASIDHANLLSRLTKSLLLNFLELTTILGNDPTQYADKMSDINYLMLNVHFVINMYRPHQAREGVKEMLQNTLEEGQREIQRCDEMKVKAEAFLSSLSDERTSPLMQDESSTDREHQITKTQSEEIEAKKLWDLIHATENGH